MKISPTSLPGVMLIELKAFGDDRGFFMDTFHADKFAEAGLPTVFKQHSMSRSVKGTVRGLHFQEPKPQGKLVQVPRGRAFDVAVDIRKGSPTFGKWFGTELSEDNKRALFIPAGFAHGFCVTGEMAEFTYKLTDVYSPTTERRVLWNDPAIGIDWPEEAGTPLLSDKDAAAPTLATAPFLPVYAG